MKRVLSLLLTVLLLCACSVPAFAARTRSLSFGEDGKFTILVATDMHEEYPMDKAETAFLHEAVEYVQPDIVVLDGDNMVCKGTQVRSYRRTCRSRWYSATTTARRAI